ncbi:F-box protein [Aspergillus homomorphus CBS 101889]|uniref:F-box domain-containing protein n=1 Tax=Aspergillus homomorphus (strain CBS 101889) TaxID=1450537 RepID=A0A395I5B6_ASPHC|nr:hypothetical protein BO97DRAFT_411944 [Aspergillus homomorphus CBS 101889]RAL15187.1 hypothetical protein BO97DRAFT_411944 [Aspergillus homomorphus CBS 101889]
MSIASLPDEILDSILCYLDLPDWCALRLSCRALYSKSLATFVSRHVNRISVLITRDGLRELEAIASHDVFRLHVQELWLIPEVFRGHYDTDYNTYVQAKLMAAECLHQASDEHGMRILTTEQARLQGVLENSGTDYEAYQAAVSSHLQLVEAELLPHTLAACMRQFTNLSAVGLETYPPSTARIKHPPCLGRKTLHRQLRHHPFSNPDGSSRWQESPDFK